MVMALLNLFLMIAVRAAWVSPNGIGDCSETLPCAAILAASYCANESVPVIIDLLPGNYNVSVLSDSLLDLKDCNFTIRASAGAELDFGSYGITITNGALFVSNVTIKSESGRSSLFDASNAIVVFEQCNFSTPGSVLTGTRSVISITNSFVVAYTFAVLSKSSSLTVNHCFMRSSDIFALEKVMIGALNSSITLLNSEFILNLTATIVAGGNCGISAANLTIRSISQDLTPVFLLKSGLEPCPIVEKKLANIRFILDYPAQLIHWLSPQPPCSALDLCSECTISTPSSNFSANQWRLHREKAWETTAISSVSFLPPGAPTKLYSGLEFGFSVELKDFFGNAVPNIGILLVVHNGTNAILSGQDSSAETSVLGIATFSRLTVTGTPGPLTLLLRDGIDREQGYTTNITLNPTTAIETYFPVLLLPCAPGYGFVSSRTKCSLCPAGTYNRLGNFVCLPCPKGAICSGGTALSTRKGWWWSGDNCAPTFEHCFQEASCCTENCPLPECSENLVVSWDNADCGANRHGILCTQCDEGFSEWGGECADCKNGNDKALAFAYLQPIFFMQLGMFLNVLRTPDGRTTAGQVVFFYQVAALLLANSNHNFGFLSWALLDLSVSLDTKVTCVLDVSPISKLSLAFIGPLLPLMYSLITFLLLLMGCKFEKLSWVIHKLGIIIPQAHMIPAITMKVMMLASFLPLSRAVFSLFVCTERASTSVLKQAPAVYCWTGSHSVAGAIGIFLFILLLLVPLGVHFFLRFLLKRHEKDLASREYMYMYGELYVPFRQGEFATWYRPLLMLQSLLIATVPSLATERRTQLFTSLILLVTFLVLHLALSPHRSPKDLFRAKCHFLLLIMLAILESVDESKLLPLLVIILALPLLTALLGFCSYKVNKKRSKTISDKIRPSTNHLEISENTQAFPPPPLSSLSFEKADKISQAANSSAKLDKQDDRSGSPKGRTGRESSSSSNTSTPGKRISLPIVAAALLTQTAAQVFVDPLGEDVGTCSSFAPCRSITYAHSQWPTSGDVQMFLNPGQHVFDDQTFSIDGAAYTSISILSTNSSNRAKIVFSPSAYYWSITNCDNCLVANLDFNDAENGVIGVFNSASIAFLKCDFVNVSNVQYCGGAIYADAGAVVDLVNCAFVSASARRGGAVCVSGHMFVGECSFSGCSGVEGGAIYGLDSTSLLPSVAIFDSTFNHCGASISGGAIGGVLDASVVRSGFIDNWAGTDGAAFSIWGESLLKCVNCTMRNNLATEGSAAYIWNSSANFSNSVISDNGYAEAAAGALVVDAAQVFISRSSLNGNRAARGSAIIFKGTLPRNKPSEISFCEMSDNKATYGGAMVFLSMEGNVSILNSNFASNYAIVNGGGLYIENSTTFIAVANTSFRENSATNCGVLGSVFTYNVKFHSCSFIFNSAIKFGGAVCAHGSNVSIENSSFISQSVENGGGALFGQLESVYTLADNMFRGNLVSSRANGLGGAMYLFGGARAVVTNCSFINNLALLRGGAIALVQGVLNVSKSNFLLNVAPFAGAILNEDGRLYADISIFRNNSAQQGGAIMTGRFRDCKLEPCSTSLAATASVTALTQCQFLKNIGTQRGGAMFVLGSYLSISTSLFDGNTAPVGGALHLGSPLVCNFFGCDFESSLYSSFPEATSLYNNNFTNNVASNGGAIAFGLAHGRRRENPCFGLNASQNRFFSNNSAVRGVVAYWAEPSAVLGQFLGTGSCCPTCFASNEIDQKSSIVEVRNKSYSNLEGSALGEMIFLDCPSVVAPGTSFACVLEFRDHFELPFYEAQMAAKIVFGNFAVNPVSEGLLERDCDIIVSGGSLLKRSVDGIATFHLEVRGDIGDECRILFQSFYVSEDQSFTFNFRLIHNITLAPCPPNQVFMNGSCSRCELNTFTIHGEACRPCLLHMICGLETVLVDQGFWPTLNPDGELLLAPCVEEVCCANSGACPFELGALPDLKWSFCKENHEGILCGQCTSGFVKWGGTCVECSSPNFGYGFFLAVLSFIVVSFILFVPSSNILKLSPSPPPLPPLDSSPPPLPPLDSSTTSSSTSSSSTSSSPPSSRLTVSAAQQMGLTSSFKFPSVESDDNGWDVLHPHFIARVLMFQSLAPILRSHEGWNFLHVIELASLNLNFGVRECVGNFTPVGQIVSGVLFPLSMFPWALLLGLSSFKRHRLPLVKEIILTLCVLCLQPCVRSAAALLACHHVGEDLILSATSQTCYTGQTLALQVIAWIFLMVLLIVALIGYIVIKFSATYCSSDTSSKLMSWFPTIDLFYRLVGHVLVTAIAASDWADLGTGVVFIAMVCCSTITLLGANDQHVRWLALGGFLVLCVAAHLEFLIFNEDTSRYAGLVMLTVLVALCLLEALLAFRVYIKPCNRANKKSPVIELSSR